MENFLSVFVKGLLGSFLMKAQQLDEQAATVNLTEFEQEWNDRMCNFVRCSSGRMTSSYDTVETLVC